MLTRVEKNTSYLFKAWDNSINDVVDGCENAPSEAKLATFLRQEKNQILLDIIDAKTTMIMYAVEVSDFQDIAAKSGKVIFIDETED